MKTSQMPVMRPVSGGKPAPVDWHSWLNDGLREVSEIRNKIPFARYAAWPVSGQSLKAAGVHDGDFLICRETSRYIPGRIGIWQTPNGETAKYAFTDDEGFVVLHNHDGWTERWAPEDIRILALVVRIERDLE